ncbi:MAG: HTH domain-containing protein [Muribaculum sp.]|nr:HTH domain-containing protein [Muribaculum sp.]
MKDNPLVTINELATILSISDRAVSKPIKKLQSDGVIRRVGAARGGYWQVINH